MKAKRHFGFYDLMAVLVGMTGAATFFYVSFGSLSDFFLPWPLLAAHIAVTGITLWFRKTIVLSRGIGTWFKAVGIGYLCALLFGAIYIPIIGAAYAAVVTLVSWQVMVPMSIAALYILRWADSLDCNSMADAQHPVLGGANA